MNDEDIRRRVLRELKGSEVLHGNDLAVEVDDGVVTLSGTVEGYGRRWEARELAYQVDGVRNVVNRLKVMLVSAPVAGLVAG